MPDFFKHVASFLLKCICISSDDIDSSVICDSVDSDNEENERNKFIHQNIRIN
jgi:hypothetical protein